MERVGRGFRSPEEAAQADREAMWALSPAERFAIAWAIRERIYGKDPPDVRADRSAARILRR